MSMHETHSLNAWNEDGALSVKCVCRTDRNNAVNGKTPTMYFHKIREAHRNHWYKPTASLRILYSESTPRVYWTHPEAWREQRRWDECWKLRTRSSGVTWGEHDVPYTWNPRSTAAVSRLRKPVRREQSFLWTSLLLFLHNRQRQQQQSDEVWTRSHWLDSMKSRLATLILTGVRNAALLPPSQLYQLKNKITRSLWNTDF